MTPAEKEAYLLKKKEERKKKLADRIKARNVQLRKVSQILTNASIW